uniref:Uncharacterized protein n=1 Tax=Coturnix japonica TaxID=93934 RepID=A0A8C2T2G9_COTJA
MDTSKKRDEQLFCVGDCQDSQQGAVFIAAPIELLRANTLKRYWKNPLLCGCSSSLLSIPAAVRPSALSQAALPAPIAPILSLSGRCSRFRRVAHRSRRASRSDSSRVSTSPSRTGPFTLRMMERLPPARHYGPLTCVHCPWEPVRPSTLVTCGHRAARQNPDSPHPTPPARPRAPTLANLMGCTRLVSMAALTAGRRKAFRCSLI